MRKRIIVFLLSAAMVFSCLPFTMASAAIKAPETKDAIVLDCDRAVLLAAYPGYSGISVREKGFFYGTKPDKLKKKVLSKTIERGALNVLITGLKPQTVYYYQSYIKTSSKTYKGNVVQFTTPEQKTWTAESVIFDNSNDRYRLIFGSARKYYKMSSPPFGYNGKSEAQKHIVKVTVKTWALKNGKKVTAKRSLYVHYKLAKNVKAIFNEIYNLNIRYPVMALTGFSYRRMVIPWISNNPYMSQHSFGTCIDLNKPYNLFYRSRDKRNKKSPYYTPKSVINIFKKYGWFWGGEFKEGLDTMHFQYLGPELTNFK